MRIVLLLKHFIASENATNTNEDFLNKRVRE